MEIAPIPTGALEAAPGVPLVLTLRRRTITSLSVADHFLRPILPSFDDRFMSKSKIQAADETAISEITIQPDGRLFVFGASGQLLELFADLGWADDGLAARVDLLREHDARGLVDRTPTSGQSDVGVRPTVGLRATAAIGEQTAEATITGVPTT